MKINEELKLPLLFDARTGDVREADNKILMTNACSNKRKMHAAMIAINERGASDTDLDRAINAGAAHADRADELYSEVRGISQRLITITKQRDELADMLDLALDAACQPYACGEDFCDQVSALLSTIKEQKDVTTKTLPDLSRQKAGS